MDNVQRKPVRTISGVTPLTVVVQPLSCKWRCTYCPTFEGAPKSYTPLSPAIMRAAPLNYDPYKQLTDRLQQLKSMQHPTNKIELIIIGGTFLDPGSCTLDYQYAFIKSCYDAMNEKTSTTLVEAQKLNEQADNRCVALCIETRPDVCEENHIDRMLEFGTTRCELGVQAIDDQLYKNTKRGHNVQAVQTATARLKDAAFKVGYHWMPGLPGSNIDKDLAMYKEIFENPAYKPDHLKIYPTQIMEGTILEQESKKTGWQTYDEETLLQLLIAMKKITPRYCRIMRIMRAVPHKYLREGIKHSDIRKILAEKMHNEGSICQCIRCREIGFNKKKNINQTLTLKTTTYEASKGKEYFLEHVNDKDTIFGLARLRLPTEPYRKEITKKSLLVRELHVYGKELALNEREEKAYQHQGLGKQLLKKTEEIAQQEGCDKIVVISGIGVRDYYRKHGYILEGPYMVKQL